MKHIKQIDGLRFIAVLLVIIEHFGGVILGNIPSGYYGVDLFFVISGFLITGILINSNGPFSVAYKKFIARRTLRIFPLYYLTVIILFFINPVVQKYIVYFLTYTYNYILMLKARHMPGNMGHFWSLCVEEQFYLLWPFLVLGLRQNIKLLKYVITGIIIICHLQNYFYIFPSLAPLNYYSIFPNANSLVIGGLGAILLNENKIPLKILESKWLEYLAIIILIITLGSSTFLKFSICPLVSLFLILKTTHKGFSITPLNNFLNNKKIVYFGSISYGIYVFHVPIGYYFELYIFDPVWNSINFESLGPLKKIKWQSAFIKVPLYASMSIVVAHFSYKYFERPFLLLKDKYFK